MMKSDGVFGRRKEFISRETWHNIEINMSLIFNAYQDQKIPVLKIMILWFIFNLLRFFFLDQKFPGGLMVKI